MKSVFEIVESEEYGAFLKVDDVEIADEFDDFLTEECYVLFEQKFESDHVVVHFGQAGSVEKIRLLVERFEQKQESTS